MTTVVKPIQRKAKLKIHLFFAVSMSKNQYKFEWQSIKKQYFEIWIDLYALAWQKRLLNSTNLIVT